MTYCVGLKLRYGLVVISGTRTNAGIDSISSFRGPAKKRAAPAAPKRKRR